MFSRYYCIVSFNLPVFFSFFSKRGFLSDVNFRKRSDRWRKNRRVPKNNGLNESSRNYENAQNYEKRPYIGLLLNVELTVWG